MRFCSSEDNMVAGGGGGWPLQSAGTEWQIYCDIGGNNAAMRTIQRWGARTCRSTRREVPARRIEAIVSFITISTRCNHRQSLMSTPCCGRQPWGAAGLLVVWSNLLDPRRQTNVYSDVQAVAETDAQSKFVDWQTDRRTGGRRDTETE